MLRALIGAVVAAVAMYIIGFLFFATPLAGLGTGRLDDNQAAAVQQALAANVPATGTYYVPDPATRAQSEMFSRGPVAMIGYDMHGFSASDSSMMIGGFVHMLVVALLLALFLHALSRHVRGFGERLKITGIGIAGAAVLMRLGGPIWDHQDWTYAIYVFVADLAMLAAAAVIILKLLPPQPPVATPAGATSDL
ncbi:MAG TPA: hypothetical protein VJ859_02085 [Allosphingosinicella sp.]|nr:hypothetical protein [Allosphingosinicella sp.]